MILVSGGSGKKRTGKGDRTEKMKSKISEVIRKFKHEVWGSVGLGLGELQPLYP